MRIISSILFVFLIIGALLGSFLWQKDAIRISKKEIDRIVSLSPAHTQLLDYLGLGDKIVAISVYDEAPNYQDRIKIGGGVLVEEEDLLTLNPDLVTVGDIQAQDEIIRFLNSRNIRTLPLATSSFQDIYQSILELQKLFSQQTSYQLINDYKNSWDNIINNPVKNRKTVLVVLELDPIYTISTNNYLSELLSYAGWDNVIDTDNAYPILDEEELYNLPTIDDILISSDFLLKEYKALTKIKNITKAKRIVVLSNKHVNLPSPYLVSIIKELRQQQSSD